ncbi:MAG: ribosome silencing factor [Rhodobacterales bacterium]|nr:ribosome silencing factor [Rhodobacterales bacterium]
MCTQEAPIQPEQLAQAFATVALDHKAQDVVILDMRGLIDYADIFVLCTANNRRQVQAIAESVRQYSKKELKTFPNSVEGADAARWVLVDFGDVVVHVFDEPHRGFYDLDGLWLDAPRLATPTDRSEVPADEDN